MSGVPYLGSKISLISKSEIRYEGILVDVNPQESTITFEKVRFFGTEGRRPGNEVPAMERVFEYVVFRSVDIKDLQVYESAPVAESTEMTLPDPAVVSITLSADSDKKSSTGFQYQARSGAPRGNEEVVRMPQVHDYASAAASSTPREERSQPSFHGANARHTDTVRGHGSSHRGSHPPRQHNGPRIVVPDSEFDFSSSNAKFSKNNVDSVNVAMEQTAPAYNKSASFFDDISCQAKEQPGHRNHNDRQLNMETFGQAAPQRRYNSRGRGRGGYHGSHQNRDGNHGRGGYQSRDGQVRSYQSGHADK